MNKVILIGNLTKDIELKTSGETNYCRFSIAVKRKKDEVDFINCLAFGKTAELLNQYCSKGSKISIVGRLEVSQYKGKNNENITSYDVIIEDIEFLSNKGQNQSEKTNNVLPQVDTNQDEMPF